MQRAAVPLLQHRARQAALHQALHRPQRGPGASHPHRHRVAVPKPAAETGTALQGPSRHHAGGGPSAPRYLFLRCWMLPRQRKRPLTMMAILVHRASHSSMLPGGRREAPGGAVGAPRPPPGPALSHLWDVSTTDLPSLTRLRMQSHKNRRAPGSIPVVGSSCNNAVSPGQGPHPALGLQTPLHCPH